MAKTIDEKVVEMKFDNKNFEKNVQNTLFSLEKLKQSLKLPESSKSLESLQKSLSKVDVSNLTNGLESAKTRFSALEVVGVTALANITNSAVNAGKKIVSALTIEPVKTGFQEYELKMDSVKVIMASTGESVETVNKYLDELNEYSDKTIYKFSDMTKNIGKFTNAGVKLEDAVIAMKGLSNEAALSGASNNEAAGAMYNFAQALSMGYVQLIDWKSIENNNMATIEFKQNLLDTAVALGTVTKTSDGLYKSGTKTYNLQQMFKDGLKDQWLTTDVLLGTLKDYGDETTEIGKKAYAAAQDVNTFTQMWSVLKETAQSGWAKTWELIFGDINKAKSIFTPLTKFFSNMIDKMSDARNTLIQSAFSKNFKSLMNNINKSVKSIKEVTDTVKDYGKVVDKIINGEFGTGQDRWNKLTESGYDWAHAQNLVNERLGNTIRHATNYTEVAQNMTDAQNNIVESTSEYIVELSKLSDEQLIEMGLSDKIESLRNLQEASEKTGIELGYLIDHIDEIDGRFLLLNSFKKIGKSLLKIFKSIGEAWNDAFPPMSGDVLFNLIAGFHKFSTVISTFVNDNAKNLTRTLKGLFAILDIITTFVGGGFKIAFSVLQGILEGLGYSFSNVLELTGFVGDKLSLVRDIINGSIIKAVSFLTSKIKTLIKSFKDWYNSTSILSKGLELISSAFNIVVGSIKDFITNNKILQTIFDKLSSGFEKITNSINNLDVSNVKNIGINIIEGLSNGIGSGITKVLTTIKNIAIAIIDAFAKILHIKSPSRVFFGMGDNIIQGLVNGLTNGNTKILETITNLGKKIKEIFEKIDIGRWLAILTDTIIAKIASPKLAAAYGAAKTLLGGFGVYMFQIFDTIQNGASNADFITNIVIKIKDSLKNLLESIKTWFSGIKDVENPAQYIILGLYNGIKSGISMIAGVIKNLATVIYTTICKALGIKSPSKVFFAIGGFIIAGLIGGLASGSEDIVASIKNLGDTLINTFKKIDFGKIFAAGLTVGLLYTANKIIKTVDNITSVVSGVISPLKAFANMMNGITKAVNTYVTESMKIKKTKAIGTVVKQFAESIAILAASIWLLSKIEYSTDMWKLFGYLAALSGLMIGMILLMKLISLIPSKDFSGNITKTLIGLAGTILILSIAMEKIGNTNPEVLKQGLVALGEILLGLLAVLFVYGKFVKGKGAQNMDQAGNMILKMSLSLILVSKAIKTLSKIKNIDDAVEIVLNLEAFFMALVFVSKFAGKNADKAGAMLLKSSLALLILVKVVKIAGSLKPSDVISGIAFLVLTGIFFTALIAVSKIAGKNAGKAGGMLLSASLSLLILIAVVKLAGTITPSDIDNAITFIQGVGIFFVALIAISKLAGGNALKAGAMLLEASIALLIVAGVLFLLSKMNIDELWGPLGIVAILEALFGGLIAVSKLAGSSAVKVIISITVALTLLIAGLITLTFLDQNKLKSAGIALSAIMLSLSVLIASTKLINTSGMGLASIIALGVIVLVLTGVLALLTGIDSEGLLEKVVALSTLLIAMSAALGILALVGLGGPAAMIGVLSLIGLLTAFGVLIGVFGTWNQNGELEDVLNNGLPVLEKIAYGISSFVGNLIKGFSESVLSILPYIGEQMSGFMTKLDGFIKVASSIKEDVPKGVGYLAAAIILLTAAEFINGIVNLLPHSTSLSELGENLKDFGEKMSNFGSIVKDFKPETAQAAKALAETILILGKAEIIDGITGLFGLFKGDEDSKNFAEKFKSFGEGVTEFANATKDVKSEDVKNSAEAAKMLVEVARELPEEGGLIAKLTGEKDLGKFGEKMASFGTGLQSYANSVDKLPVNTIKQSVEGAKAIIDMAKSIPNEGGLWDKIAGENGIDKFGLKLMYFGIGLKDYSDQVTGLDVDSIKKSAEGGKAIIDMASAIPNEGGLLAELVGDNGIGAFGEKLGPFGSGLKAYSDAVTGLDTDSIKNSESAFYTIIRMITRMNENATLLSNNTSMLNVPSKFDNLNKYKSSSFISNLIAIVDEMKIYTEKVSGIDLTSITNSETAINALKQIINSLQDINVNGVESFVTGVNLLSQVNLEQLLNTWNVSMTNFYNTGYNVIENIITGIKANSLNLTTLVNLLIYNSLQEANSYNTKFYDFGLLLVNSIIDGINKDISKLNKLLTDEMNQNINNLKNYSNDFYNCGVDFSQGLVNGINSMKQSVYYASFALGQEAVRGERDGQNSHSPSKETIQAGIWLGEGLIIGINNISGKVQTTANNMGKDTANNISSALSLVNNMIDFDNISEPTIRPVLDLSDVASGANTINDLFALSPSIGVMSNLGNISHDMNLRSQNGINDDIVNSINDLRKDISGLQTNSYNINGITYDDGSNISQAVNSLIDAIITERRT